MSKEKVLTTTHDLPIPHTGEVHNGKVRSVYWQNSDIGLMVISDRISAFDCNWESQSGLRGIPGKGAALNAISKYWFDEFDKKKLAPNHIIDVPHPLVWRVRRAEPIMVEAIARDYITGSMWRNYDKKNQRVFGGEKLPKGLQKNQKLDKLLVTPTTKGVIKGIPGIPEQDDVNITRQQIEQNYKAFGFKHVDDVKKVDELLVRGFELISNRLNDIGKIFVDTKFEFGYIDDRINFIDEVGTPDSSRYWDKKDYKVGQVIEKSKEQFRQDLLSFVDDKDLLTNQARMEERKQFATRTKLPDEIFIETGKLYKKLAQEITGRKIPEIKNARQEILSVLNN